MRITHLGLGNWKNFKHLDLAIQRRAFVVGPNASGKSNLLDSLRFLRDIAEPEGGFQRAVRSRGGVSQIRCLHARRQPNVVVDVELLIEEVRWQYRLEFTQDSQRRALIRKEEVQRDGETVLSRPNPQDDADESQLTQTYLEQVNANKDFRDVADALADIRYLHVIPQLVREPDRTSPQPHDHYGGDFLEQIARSSQRTRDSRLRRINEALRAAVPQFRQLTFERDERGVPHLKALHEHWRPQAGWQTEEQFSDGTLRLLGLLWAFLDGDGPLLLEEPELSLHSALVRHIPGMMARAGGKARRQVIVSTHSSDLLSDKGIAPEEVVLLTPSRDGTAAQLAADFIEIRALLEGGVPIGEVVMAQTAPEDSLQLALFGG